MTLLQHHVLALSLTTLTTFGLGLLVFLADPKRRLNQIFGLYSLAITGWAVGEIFTCTASAQSIASMWAYYVGWPSVISIAPTFLHSVFLSIGEKDEATRVALRVSYVLSFIFLALHFFSPGFLTKDPQPSTGYEHFHQALSVLGGIIPLTFVILVNLALWRLWRSYSQATGQRRTQLKYLFWASVVGYVGGSPDWCLVYRVHLPLINPFGLYGVPLYSIALTYAVFQHRLFDFHLVVRKSLAYSLLITSLTVGYFGLVYTVEWLFRTTFGYHSVWLSLAAFALMALVFQPLKVGIQRIVDQLFFQAPHEEVARRMERLEQEVRQVDKLKAVSMLAAGMAHEIKNPLTSLKTFATYLPEKGNDPAFQRKFQQVVTQEVDKIDHIVRRLLEFAKPAPPQLEPAAVSQLLNETLEFLSSEALRRRIEITRTYDDTDTIQADPQQLRQVFLNLFLNSLEAMTPPPARLPGGPAPDGAAPPLVVATGGGVNGSGGTLSVTTARHGSNITVTIRDTGKGISKEHLNHIFDPFFTTKSNGTGLGLSIVQSIVTEHRGTIVFESQPDQGTTCTLIFPLSLT